MAGDYVETSSLSAAQPRIACRHCGALCRSDAKSCWFCEQNPRTPLRSATQFSVQSILLVMTLIAACLAVLRWSPPTGIVLIVFVVPSLARTILGVVLQRWRTPPLSIGEKCWMFLLSLAVMWTAAMVALAALVLGGGVAGLAALILGLPPGITGLAAYVGGIGSALAAAGWVLWISRPDRYGSPI